MLRKMYLVALISLVHVLTPSEAKPCFITNCPPGGKRSSAVVPFIPPPVVEPQCVSCGPSGEGGNCLGPDLCCGPAIGCYFKTKETGICLLNNITAPSSSCDQSWWQRNLTALPCNLDDDSDGTCVSNGLCCSIDKCQLHLACQMTSQRALDGNAAHLFGSSAKHLHRFIEY